MSFLELSPNDLVRFPSPKISVDFYAGLEVRQLRLMERLQNWLETQQSGKGNRFRRRMEDIFRAAPDEDRMIKVIATRSYILPLLTLWQGDRVTGRSLEPTPRLLAHLECIADTSKHGRLSRLALRALFFVFCRKYDELKHLDKVCETLRRQMGQYAGQKLLFGLDEFKAEAVGLLNTSGHEYLARMAEDSDETGETLDRIAADHGIPTDSRFFEAAQIAYYVEGLKRLGPNAPSSLLDKVRRQEVYEKPLGGECLGHVVLRILIDTLLNTGQKPTTLWRDTLFDIGGDPQVPSYRDTWWIPLGYARYATPMIAWLSERNLNLFLKLFAKLAQRNDKMNAMFPARETFLRGLLEKNLIHGTRLFLSKQAREDMKEILADEAKKNNEQDKQPKELEELGLSKLTGGQPGFVAFHLNLGTAHLVEGTHDFALHIMDKVPSKSPLLSYEKKLSYQHLVNTPETSMQGLEGLHKQQFGTSGFYARVKHDGPRGAWQREAVIHLRNEPLNIDVRLEDVIAN